MAATQFKGIRRYYIRKIHDVLHQLHQKEQHLLRLEAETSILNSRVRKIKEEVQLLQDPGSYSHVGLVRQVIDKHMVLVRIVGEGMHVVDVDENIDVIELKPSTRVALRRRNYTIHAILQKKLDPVVKLSKVQNNPECTYDMIGGLDGQIKEIKEVIELPIRHPELFELLGIAEPKGVLLYGPPGTGKTLLARAVAHHAKCSFVHISATKLAQKYIGVGAKMVRELFFLARKYAPCIIFMDEIDSIGSARVQSGGGTDSEVQRTMLELLSQLDGFEASSNIKVIIATNRIDILDQALLRPGRIDRKIKLPNPTEQSRWEIMKIHSRKMNLRHRVDLKRIVEKMNGASGAEIKAVCTEAGMFALRERRVHVMQEDFEMAVGKVMKKETEKNISLQKFFY
ncbi:AAA-type ATPase family protein [Prunus dulcis]|uniref:AAA-type ATPase family protein n=1 Tax=Prunus dulcis TaxID=3755 RepID=A0A4Y1QZ86_PRUDU|nr:AAA-type ATPase family protein [Prunus dulcis]